MFGRKALERGRATLVRTLRAKSVAIMLMHADKAPDKIPWIDVARATILGDIADIIEKLGVEEHPEDKE
jgi:hypothetical protein